jgi:hypothetical protein
MFQYGSWILLILVLFLFLWIPRKETFFQKIQEKILTSQRLNFEKSLPDNKLVSIPFSTGWEYVLFKLYTKQNLDIYGSPKQVILDPVDYDENATMYQKKDLEPGYFFIFTSPSKKDDFQCGFDFTGKKIGYFDRCEKRLIQSILYGYRTTGKPISLSIDYLGNLKNIWKQVDLLVLYLVPGSPLTQMIELQELALLNIKDISIDRLHITHPYLSLVSKPKEDFFVSNNRILTSSNSLLLLEMKMALVDLSSPLPTTEPFITRLNLSKEYTDPSYKCIGDENIQSPWLCKSAYDIYGEPKPTPTIWDSPCKTDEDCPFFQANQNYPNQRGRCLSDGSCEMPLGITRVGYKKFYDRDPYQPFCYQCKNIKDKNCCESQQAMADYTLQHPSEMPQTYLRSADYAFKEDTEERKKYNLPTYIHLTI